MDKLPEIFGFKAEVPLADGIGGEGVEPFDPRADDEFRERARLVQRLRGGFGRFGGGGHERGHVAEQVVHDVLRAGGAARKATPPSLRVNAASHAASGSAKWRRTSGVFRNLDFMSDT